MKKIYNILGILFLSAIIVSCNFSDNSNTNTVDKLPKKKRTLEQKAEDTKERLLYEFNMQKNPLTGEIPGIEKEKELQVALLQKESRKGLKTNVNTYISRGPSNLGGRTRSVIVDVSDTSGNTLIAGGVSSGVFRTTDGGNSWTKVSSNSEIHNVTSIAQDPRPGFQNIWYYGTGEFRGNSASLSGASYLGNGIWKSTDSGLTWQQMPETTNGSFTVFDNFFDFIIDMEVHPTTGELFVAAAGKIYRMSSTGPVVELEYEDNGVGWTDVEITSSGRVYAAIDGRAAFNNGVYTSLTGNGSWQQIAFNDNPTGWNVGRRITLAVAPSNENIVYALFDNGKSNSESNRVSEADLWQYNFLSSTWTDYSSKMPDEPGGNSNGNDPFSHQGSYDLVISVKPTDENFLVIGGTNIYKIANITTDAMFSRIGGYRTATSYALYNEGGVSHHPDVHAVAWDLNDTNTLFSGTDGGVHKTTNLNTNFVSWQNLNNNYLTYQYYHVNMLNKLNSDYVIGGAQDNGTTVGGLDAGRADTSEMISVAGGDGAAVAISEEEGVLENVIYRYLTTQRGPLYRNPSTGGFTQIDPDGATSQFVTYFYMDPDNTKTLYYAGQGRVYMTNDAVNVTSATWTDLGTIPKGEEISVFATTRGTYNASSSYLLIGGKDGSLYKLNDPQNATSFLNLKNITPSGVFTGNASTNGQYTSGISIHPTNPDIVMVTYASYGSTIRNIFITNNATSETPTWVEVERNLASHSIRSGVVADVNGQTQYLVGTARGLYRSLDPETTDWQIEAPETIGLAVVSGLVYRPSDNTLLVGTHGNGIFETKLTAIPLSLENNIIDETNIVLYPNPTQFELKLASKNDVLTENTKYSVFDIRGSKVLEGKLSSNSIDVSKLSKGMYIITFKNENTTLSKKFMKN